MIKKDDNMSYTPDLPKLELELEEDFFHSLMIVT